jgi:hypothetical protein
LKPTPLRTWSKAKILSNLKTFQIDRSEVTCEASNISCLAYALLLAGDTDARDLIFHGKLLLDNSELITKLHWRPVDAPNEGDIVAYLGKDWSVLHYGYYLGEGLVRSKFGNGTPYSYVHRLFDTPELYEDRIIFLRKSKNTFSGIEETPATCEPAGRVKPSKTRLEKRRVPFL